MANFSEFFTFEELTNSEDHSQLVPQNRVDAKVYINAGKRLSKLLETIRIILGEKPIKINSGFRNARLNTAVKSKNSKSKHTVFEAADIKPSSMSIDEAFKMLIHARKSGLLPDLRKVLQEGSWLHVEVSMSEGDYRGFFVSHDGNTTWNKVA